MASLPKKPSHLRGDSFELDVFDAKLYFSGAMDAISLLGSSLGSMRHQGGGEEEEEEEEEEANNIVEIEKTSEKKKWTKPKSPGAKFVSILKRKLKRSSRSGFVGQKEKGAESNVEKSWSLELERRRRRGGGDGGEEWKSDCSSDLFELKSCDLVK